MIETSEKIIMDLINNRFNKVDSEMHDMRTDIKSIVEDIQDERDKMHRLIIQHENCPEVINDDISKLREETRGIRAVEYLFVTYPKIMWAIFVAAVLSLANTVPSGIERLFKLFNS